MENFTYFNPTRIHFGRGQITSVDAEIPASARVLLLAGGGSIRTNGVHAQVRKALGSRYVAEFFGVEANPDFDTLMKAVELVRRDKLDCILSVGGGSVADGAKFVAAAVPFKGDPWEILLDARLRRRLSPPYRGGPDAPRHGLGGEHGLRHQPAVGQGEARLPQPEGLPPVRGPGP